MATLPAPIIPALGPDNTIDLEALGNAPLVTYVPGLNDGDPFWPNWRGCSADGAAVDFFEDLLTADNQAPDGTPVEISNATLTALDQGWVFYSYQLDAQGSRGEESQRLFFYVGSRPQANGLLPAPQVKESNQLTIHVQPQAQDLSVVAPAYWAMAIGDVATLTIELLYEGEELLPPIIKTFTVDAQRLGAPLQWTVGHNDLLLLEFMQARMRYSINHGDGVRASESDEQVFLLVFSALPTLLPALSIECNADDDCANGVIDPGKFAGGLTLTIPPYPGLRPGDDILLYASDDRARRAIIKAFRTDPSSVNTGLLQVHIEHDWLEANSGSPVTFQYQYARVGNAGTGTPLTVDIAKALNLPAPFVKDANVVGPGFGTILMRQLEHGATITLPQEAEVGNGRVRMFWPPVYFAEAEPDQSFHIPPTQVPAYIGKRLDIYYDVLPVGAVVPIKSDFFNLEIKAPDSGWPMLQYERSYPLSVGANPNGAQFWLDRWPFMAAGQRIRVRFKGRAAGQDVVGDIRVGAAEIVTEAEFAAQKVGAVVPYSFLRTLEENSLFTIEVHASFDGGKPPYQVFPFVKDQRVVP